MPDARHRQPPEDSSSSAAKSASAARRSRARASARSDRKRSTPPAMRLRRGPSYRRRRRPLDTATSSAPMIRDLGATLAMRPRAERPCAWCSTRRWARPARRWTARTCTLGDFDWGMLPAAAPLAIAALTHGRHGHGVRARRSAAAGRGVVHRRRRIVARRMARGDQPLRRAPAAGDLLRPEQPDRAVDAGVANSPRCACSPTRRPATASRASRSTAPIPRRSPPPSPGRPSGRAPALGRR